MITIIIQVCEAISKLELPIAIYIGLKIDFLHKIFEFYLDKKGFYLEIFFKTIEFDFGKRVNFNDLSYLYY